MVKDAVTQILIPTVINVSTFVLLLDSTVLFWPSTTGHFRRLMAGHDVVVHDLLGPLGFAFNFLAVRGVTFAGAAAASEQVRRVFS